MTVKGRAAMPRACATYLLAVHLVFADDLDGHLAGVALEVASAVDVAEGAIAHLLDELPPLEPRVPGKLAPACILLGHQARDIVVGHPLLSLVLVGVMGVVSVVLVARRMAYLRVRGGA
jgi:hypothetical protein